MHEETITLRRRRMYTIRDITWAFGAIGIFLLSGPRIILGSPLARSAVGEWAAWIAMAVVIAGIVVIANRRLRSSITVLSGQGLTIRDKSAQQSMAWSELVAVATKTRADTQGVHRTIELRFGRQSPVYLDDEFSVGREHVVELIRERAVAAGANAKFSAEDPAADTKYARTAWMGLAIYGLSLLLVIAVVIILSIHAHARH